MSYRTSGFKKSSILILSAILAGIIIFCFVPTPNVVDGGAAKMILFLFLTVGLKATIEYLLSKRGKP
jgi:hypothetical protein